VPEKLCYGCLAHMLARILQRPAIRSVPDKLHSVSVGILHREVEVANAVFTEHLRNDDAS